MNTIPISIDKARYWAITSPHVVFYGSLASNLVDRLDSSLPTAATDGKTILWNPDWVATLTDAEVRFVLLHETLHCAHAHFDRLPHDSEGNVAGDYAINLILSKIDGITMPKGGLLDSRFADMAEEEIFADLRKPKPKPQPGQGQPQPGQGQGQPQAGQGQGQPDPGQCGGFTAPAPQAPGKAPLKEQWDRALITADMARRSVGRGSVPGHLQAQLDKLTAAAAVDWKQETADFVKSVVTTRNDWSRSARRMALAPVIYPRRKTDGIGLLVVARDTSGSIDRKLCSEFTSQINNVVNELGCEAIVLDCDTKIHAEYRIGDGVEAPLDAVGGGGTSFDPVFARVNQLVDDGEAIAGLIYLTDGDGELTPGDSDYPVLWVVYGGRETPMETGRTLLVK